MEILSVDVVKTREAAPMNEMLALLQPSDEAKASTISHPHKCANVISSSAEFKQGIQSNPQGIQSNPSAQYPSFFKQLLKSHLSGKFYLGLPKKFCDAHLPSHDDNIILVDETEQEYTVKYSFRKHRLCCGWRCFSVAHKLQEGDALIFNLIECCKFRVYIVRAGKLAENDGALCLQTFDAQNVMPISSVKMENQVEENVCIGEKPRHMHKNTHIVYGHQEANKARLISDRKLGSTQYGNSVHHFGSNVSEAIRYPEYIPVSRFEGVKGFEDFKIHIDGQILDSEIPANIRMKYFMLCCSQKSFLHNHLIEGLSTKFASAMISETVDISDAIRSANLSTPLHRLECWNKTLKAFEDLGLVVGFLRDRVRKLINVSNESHSVAELKRRKIAQADKEISDHEATSFNIKALMGNIAAEVKVLKCKNERLGLDFEQLAGAPW